MEGVKPSQSDTHCNLGNLDAMEMNRGVATELTAQNSTLNDTARHKPASFDFPAKPFIFPSKDFVGVPDPNERPVEPRELMHPI